LDLIPQYFFLVTNWSKSARSAEEILAHYRRRGTFEDRLGEFKSVIGVHLSQPGFKENEATMLLALLAFNLTSICRNELEDSLGGCWDLKRFQLFVLKVGAVIVKRSRRLIMRIADLAAPLWRKLTECIGAWRVLSKNRPRLTGFRPPPDHVATTLPC
jgi:hypothetical protein